MLTSARVTRIGIPAILAIVALLALGLWAFMGGASGGMQDSLGYTGTVEYKIFGADGVLKSSGVGHNTVMGPGEEATVSRLVVIEDITTAKIYNDIAPLDTAKSGGAVVAGDGTENIAITTGPTVSTGVDLGGGDTTGNATVVTEFTASGAAPIVEIQLVSGDPTLGAGMNYLAGVVLAYQTVDITLANLDTLEVTWTIDIDGA